MGQQKYVIGVDFGTESGRAVLVDVNNGEEIATHFTVYPNGVIDERLPDTGGKLEADFALQNPSDYLEVLKCSVPAVLHQAGIAPSDVIGIGIDFTSCTILPVDAEFVPLCDKAEWRENPHAWVKLWKHHAAQDEANQITKVAEERREPWLAGYGGKISSEWMLPKVFQVLNEAPQVYEEAELFMEAGDWVIAQMTGELKRSSCSAGFKGNWHQQNGYPTHDFLTDLDPRLGNLYETKLRGEVVSLGSKAGELTSEMAAQMGLMPETAVATGIIDAHAGALGTGCVTSGKMALVMGTSTCHLLVSEQELHLEGISGVVKDGIVPGFYAYEAGQAAVGDIFAWFVEQGVPAYVTEEARAAEISVHAYLEERASRLKPGESGLLALDWHNGNRTPLVDADLSGLIIGQTLQTKPEEQYRAFIEATGFGTRVIIDTFRSQGIEMEELYACGGLPHRNRLLMQIYADITNMEIKVSATTLTPAIGAGMLAAVAAGSAHGGYDSLLDAAQKMVRLQSESFKPNPEHAATYDELYNEYVSLHHYFGRGPNQVMKRLKDLKDRVSR